MLPIAEAVPGPIQFRTQSESLTWVASSQLPESSPTSFQHMHQHEIKITHGVGTGAQALQNGMWTQ